MSQVKVKVYSPSGAEEIHTNLNAIDLVRHAGYTYQPGRVYNPTESAPHARMTPPPGTPDPAHAALASVGSGSIIGATQVEEVLSAPAPELATATSSEAPAPAAAQPAAAPAPAAEPAPTAPAPKPRRRAAVAED